MRFTNQDGCPNEWGVFQSQKEMFKFFKKENESPPSPTHYHFKNKSSFFLLISWLKQHTCYEILGQQKKNWKPIMFGVVYNAILI